MAVIEDLGLTVRVQIDGMPTPEYDDPDPCADNMGDPAYTRVCNKYIEAKDNAEYTFQFSATGKQEWLSRSPAHAFAFEFYVDGRRMSGSLFRAAHRGTVRLEEGVISLHNGTLLLHRYRFAAVNPVDDADTKRVKSDLELAKNLGLIRVVVRRFVVSRTGPKKEGEIPRGSTWSVAEKALKGRAVSHGTTFSSAVAVKRSNKVYGEKLDPSARPYAIFHLKYRSNDALRTEMIVPRSPSPALSIDGLGREEVQRLARERLAEIKKEKSSAVKREFNDILDLTGNDAVPPPRPLKIRRRRDGRETIDLTDD